MDFFSERPVDAGQCWFLSAPPVIALLLVFPGVISPGHGKALKSRLIPLVASAFEVDAKSTKALNHKGSLFWLPGVAQASPGKNCVSLWFFLFHSLLRHTLTKISKHQKNGATNSQAFVYGCEASRPWLTIY